MNEKLKKRNSNKLKIILNVAFIALIIGIICKVFSGQTGEIWSQLKKMTIITVILVVMCSVFFNFFEGLAYYVMAKRFNKDFKWYQGVSCSYYCAFFKLSTFGTGTAASGVFYLNGYKVPPSKSLGMITINYIIQKVAIVLVCLIFFVTHFGIMREYYREYFIYVVLGVFVTILVAIVLLAVVLWKKFHGFLIFLADKVIKKKEIKNKIKSLEVQLDSLRAESSIMLSEKVTIIKLVLLNMIKYMGWYMIPCVVLGYTNVTDILQGLCISALASALVGIIPAPGAAGSTEAMFYVLFCAVAIKAQAVAVMLIYRCFTYIFPFIIGGIFILVRKCITQYQIRKKV